MEAPKRKRGIAAALVTLAVTVVAIAGAVVVVLAQQTDDPWGIHRREAQATVFDRVWLTVSQNYFDRTFGGVDWPAMKTRYRPKALAAKNNAALYNDAIWPMLSEIDSSHLFAEMPDPRAGGGYASHLRGKRGEAMSEAPDGGGDLGGLTIVHDGTQWMVYDVRVGSTPEKLGIAPGRIVRKSTVSTIDGKTPAQMKVELVLARQGGGDETFSYEFPLRTVGLYRQHQRLRTGQTLIRFDLFDTITTDWVIDRIKEAGADGVILDLRYNRGGNIGELERLAGALLPNSAPIGRSIGRMLTLPLVAPDDGAQYRSPLAVLIGPETASAGEMLADALRYNKRSLLIGDRTAGAVLTARPWKLPDGGWLTVATGNFSTWDGRRLEGVGVAPDIPVAETLEAIRQNRDLVVEAAVQSLTGGAFSGSAP